MKYNICILLLLCTVVQAGNSRAIVKPKPKLHKHAPTHFSNFGARETCIMFLERKEQTALCDLLYAIHDRLNYADLRIEGVARKGIGNNFPSKENTLQRVVALFNNPHINGDEHTILSLYKNQTKTLYDHLKPSNHEQIVQKNKSLSKDPITFDELNLFYLEFGAYKNLLGLVLAKEISS